MNVRKHKVKFVIKINRKSINKTIQYSNDLKNISSYRWNKNKLKYCIKFNNCSCKIEWW